MSKNVQALSLQEQKKHMWHQYLKIYKPGGAMQHGKPSKKEFESIWKSYLDIIRARKKKGINHDDWV